MCNLRSKQGTLQKFIRKKFCSFKNIHTFAVTVSTTLPICTANLGGTFAFYNSIKRIFKDGAWWDYYYATLSFDYKSQKLLEKFGSFEFSAYLCNNNKRKESYMETKDKKIQVHTIDYKDIDKFFPARSEITMSPLPKGHIARLATIHKVKAQ